MQSNPSNPPSHTLWFPPPPCLPQQAADRAVLRSALRDEARKAVGDTGLLDHLLKHLVRLFGKSHCAFTLASCTWNTSGQTLACWTT